MWSVATLVALFLFSSLVVMGVAAGLGSQGSKIWALAVHILLGSFAGGGLYLLIIRLQPPRSAWNLAWFIGIPAFVAILRRPRLPNLGLTLPLLFGGWISFALIAWALQITVD
jgi:hypothetical protein